MESAAEELRCVSCNASNPSDGKLLHCLHVICGACLSDSISHPGCVKCMLCREVTTPRHNGAGVGRQLASICSLLENATRVAKGNATAASSRDTSESGTSGKLNCSYCADVDLEREAVVECVECNGAPLCATHSARHPLSTGHQVRDITSSSHGKPENTKVCLLHPKYNVVKYCHTCSYCVCERCVDRGHSGHCVELIPEAARKQRSLLRGKVQEKTTGQLAPSSPEDNSPKALPITAKLSAVAAEIEEITGEATHASQRITKAFDKIAEMVEKKKMEMLGEVEDKSWKLLEPLQLRRQRLQVLRQQEAIGVRLAETLSTDDSCDNDVLDVSPLVAECFKRLDGNDRSEVIDTSNARVSVKINDSMERLQKDLNSVLTVQYEHQLDLSSCEIVLPEDITTEVQNIFEVRPPRGSPQAREEEISFPVVKCDLERQDGTACNVAVEVKNINHQQPIITITVCPEVVGDHMLTIHVQGKSRSVKFEAMPGGIRLDPAKCSPEITLSHGNRMAKLTGKEGNGCVLSELGYTSGIYEWSVKVHRCEVAGKWSYIAAGVCAASASQNYSDNCDYFPSPCYYWQSTGSAVGGDSRKSSTMWENGDFVTFKLNCDTKTLQLHIHSTGEHCVIDGIDCSQPLYPALYLYTPGHQAAICQ